jgi:hypothetical protein
MLACCGCCSRRSAAPAAAAVPSPQTPSASSFAGSAPAWGVFGAIFSLERAGDGQQDALGARLLSPDDSPQLRESMSPTPASEGAPPMPAPGVLLHAAARAVPAGKSAAAASLAAAASAPPAAGAWLPAATPGTFGAAASLGGGARGGGLGSLQPPLLLGGLGGGLGRPGGFTASPGALGKPHGAASAAPASGGGGGAGLSPAAAFATDTSEGLRLFTAEEDFDDEDFSDDAVV